MPIDVKIDRSVLEKKSSFKIPGLSFYSKLDWGSIAETVLTAIGALSYSMRSFSAEAACYIYKCRKTVVKSGLVLQFASWLSWIDYKKTLWSCWSFT